MKTKIFKQILYLFTLVLSISFASAANMTVNDLIDSFNYSYSNGSINIVSRNDFMLDKNSNGLNDTMVINLSTSIAGDGIFNFILNLIDKDNFHINATNKLITSSDGNVEVNFPTELLESGKFNYTIEITNVDNELVYREYKIPTNTYSRYETGTNVTRITDENFNNNSLRINLTINSTQAITSNVTVTLAYNSSTISKTEEKVLNTDIQTISINFDNETIKSTHYTGNFTIDSVIIGNKIFDFNQNTSVYDYENFAKTSYIKSIKDEKIDTNTNNLSEFLEINFTINVTFTDTYNLTYDLYDEFDNFVVSVNKTQTLSIGNQIMQTLINGSEIYKTKVNGPYVISFVKLAIGNETKDIIFNAHTTNQSFYTDYERPPLPDLNISMQAIYDALTNVTNITVNVSNKGQAPSFNVFLDIFDNVTYSNNRSLSFLDVGEYIIYQFNVTNSSNNSLFTAIADFDNLVDESDETNNIVQNTQESVVSLAIENLSTFYSNGTYKIFEFIILNDGDSAVTDIYWQLDTGESVISSTQNISSLAVNEKAFVYAAYNYSAVGTYDLKVNATGISQSTIVTASYESSIINELSITSFANLNTDGTKVILEVRVKNMLSTNINGINWSLDDGNGQILNSNQKFNLAPNETIFIFIQHDYGGAGTFNPIVTVTNGTYTDSKSAAVEINGSSVNASIKQATDFNGVFVMQNGTKTFYQNWSSSGMSGITTLLGVNLTREGQSNRQFYGDYSQVSDVGIICHHTSIDHVVVLNTTNASILSNMTGASSTNTGGPRCRAMFYKNSTNAIYVYEKGFNSGFGLRLFNNLNKSFTGQVEIKYPYGSSVGQKFIAKQRPGGNETAVIFDRDSNPLNVGVVIINSTNSTLEGLKQFFNMSFVPPHSNLTGLGNERSRRAAFAWTADGKGGILTISNSTMTSGTNDRNATMLMYYYNYSLNSFNYTNGKLSSSIILENTSAAVDGELCTMKNRNSNVFGIWEMRNGSVYKVMAAVLNINGTAESGYPLPDTGAESGGSNSIEYVGCYDNIVQDTVVFWWLRSGQTRLYYGLYNKTTQAWSTNNLKTSAFSTPSFASNTLRQVKKTECPEPDCFGLVFSDSNGRVYGLAAWNGTNISTVYTQNVASAEINTQSIYFLFAPAKT